MRRCSTWTSFLAAIVVLAGLSAGHASAQSRATATNVPEIPYRSVPDFVKLPDGLYLGEAMGVAQNSRGNFYVFTRSGDTRLFEFNANGNFVREIAPGFYGFEYAHKVRVDQEDNVWVVDEGSNLVMKFTPQGRLAMVLGSRPDALLGVQPPNVLAGTLNQKYVFARPADVAIDLQGNIFVADGYTNNRIVKYDRNGRYVTQFGSEVRGNGADQINLPHTMAVDAQGNVYVGDRGNARVLVLDNDLKLKTTYTTVGNPWELCVSGGPHQYLFVSNSNPDTNAAASWEVTGEIYLMELDGTILGKFGTAGKNPGQFQTVHGLDCRNPSQLLVSEISAWRVQKIILTTPLLSSTAR